MTTTLASTTAPHHPDEPEASRSGKRVWVLVFLVGGVALLSAARILADAERLTASTTVGAGLYAAIPIALAAFGGLWAERSGTVNIGLDGMMVLGAVMAGAAGWQWGVWAALIAGILGGAVGGLLMSVATTTFGVNHIIAGFAINIISPGVARYLANIWFATEEGQIAGGSITSSPRISGSMPQFSLPYLSGGGDTADWLGRLEDTGWFLLGDLGGILRGLTTDLQVDHLIAFGLMGLSAYVLWRTPFGLRLRSAGEKPGAAESLGVSVAAMRHLGMALSGGFAGLGGATLVFLGANQYQQGQVAGRGFLGLAALVFGNWLPAGIAAGSAVFGYADGVSRSLGNEVSVRALVLAAAIGLVIFAIRAVARKRWLEAAVELAVGIAAYGIYLKVEEVNSQFTYMTPYLVTLVVITIFSTRQRPPAAEGEPYFKGQSL